MSEQQIMLKRIKIELPKLIETDIPWKQHLDDRNDDNNNNNDDVKNYFTKQRPFIVQLPILPLEVCMKSFKIELPFITFNNYRGNFCDVNAGNILPSVKRKSFTSKKFENDDEADSFSDESNDTDDLDDDWWVPIKQHCNSERKGTRKYQLGKQKYISTKATVTHRVKNVFKNFFQDQIEATNDYSNNCGVCDACQQPDCGFCDTCKNMVKFGGAGCSGRHERCLRKMCLRLNNKQVSSSSSLPSSTVDGDKRTRLIRYNDVLISWLGRSLKKGDKTYHTSVYINSQKYDLQNYVLVKPIDENDAYYIGQIMFMWEDETTDQNWFHIRWFYRSCETILGETGNPQEVFLCDECDNYELCAIAFRATVVYLPPITDFSTEIDNCDGTSSTGTAGSLPDDERTFFYNKWYSDAYARFETPRKEPVCPEGQELMFCPACAIKKLEEEEDKPIVDEELACDVKRTLYGIVRWKRQKYCIGSCVFIEPETFLTKASNNNTAIKLDQSNIDEELYTEEYRKHLKRKKCSSADVQPQMSEPFAVGRIKSIFTKVNNEEIYVTINRLYRPEKTFKDEAFCLNADLNLLFWSDQECNIKFSKVTGKCYVAYERNINKVEWCDEGPYRFYFSEAYNPVSKQFSVPPSYAVTMGLSKNDENESINCYTDEPLKWPIVDRPLRCLDVFSGCGGLTEGLRSAGIAKCEWAVEIDEPAARSFQKNNSEATVFVEDCNNFLKMVMNGAESNNEGQKLPQKGDVELLCGGPPCQGFSLLNRFTCGGYSKFKNSLIATFLSYCDYYRPRYFILENVRDFISFRKNIMLKLTLNCLLRIGYQCTFALSNAAQFGVPQQRIRVIILAAAPNEILPKYPEPFNVLKASGRRIFDVNVFNKTYASTCEWKTSAPYRALTINDAISDLPVIENNDNTICRSYDKEPQTHFQRLIRRDAGILSDHICFPLSPLNLARVEHIPKLEGADWRDLPNKKLILSDGTVINKLVYLHHDKLNGTSGTGSSRGVCCCANDSCCKPKKQPKTLIPFSVVHTANKNQNWSGVLGRLSENSSMPTIITCPNPLGKQGRVIHPDQDRIVTIRECARCQGFPDSYNFDGDIKDKYKQIGNAVPPTMAIAIGREIIKAMIERDDIQLSSPT